MKTTTKKKKKREINNLDIADTYEDSWPVETSGRLPPSNTHGKRLDLKLVSNRLWQTPTISSNFCKYLWESPKFSENTSWHLQDGVCRMLTYIFFCTTNIHIFSDNLLFSSDFFKFFKDHMPASCEWGLRMLYLLHSHWAGVGNFSYIFNKTRRR